MSLYFNYLEGPIKNADENLMAASVGRLSIPCLGVAGESWHDSGVGEIRVPHGDHSVSPFWDFARGYVRHFLVAADFVAERFC